MLPFSEKNNKRKYQCFACTKEFEEYQEFKEHIIGDHDEGRDYIVCQQCSAPIRDVRTHYFAKHRGLPLQGGMQKALIWRDVSKGKTKKPKFNEGYITSLKNDGQPMHYRSGWELQVYECLEEMPEVIKYEVEALHVPYYWKDKWHKYYPDLAIHFNDGHIEIWEVKPHNQKDIPMNLAKWAACEEFCNNKGYHFMVMTEKGIRALQQKIINETNR